jgi:hypothetical protein
LGAEREDELNCPARLKRAVRKVAVIPGGDEKYPHEIEREAGDDARTGYAGEEGAERQKVDE